MAQLICKNLKVGFDSKPIADNINFSVNKGDYLCILGENGSGKTTLIKTVLGILPALDGSIEFEDRLKKNKIGYLPQQTAVQKDFPASVFEIVLSGMLTPKKLTPFFTKAEKEAATEALEKLNIPNLKHKSYRELSGGQQQRVLLARAIAAKNEMLILDEPAASLDPKATNELYELLYKLNKDESITVIMISHNIESAVKYADKILHIGNTQLFFGDVHAYIHSEAGQVFCPNCKGEL